ncbi:MAG: hypothetical protein JXR07_09640 [Reichenbachiella sp.]
MSLRKFRNSTFKRIKDGLRNYIDRDHFMGHSALEGDHQQVKDGELIHSSNPHLKEKK